MHDVKIVSKHGHGSLGRMSQQGLRRLSNILVGEGAEKIQGIFRREAPEKPYKISGAAPENIA